MTDLHRIRQIAGELFDSTYGPQRIAANPYIQSHAFYSTRLGLPELPHVPPRYESTKLSTRVSGCDQLGPYEQHVLSELLLSPANAVVIVGAAGSGKTVSVHEVINHFNHHYVSRPSSSPEADRPFGLYYDFNPQAEQVVRLARSATTEREVIETEDEAIRHVCSGIQAALIQALGPPNADAKLLDLIEAAKDVSTGHTKAWLAPNATFNFAADMLKTLAGVRVRTGEAKEDFERITERIAEKRPLEQLSFWCGIIELQHLKWFGTPDTQRHIARTTFFVLDNVDPLPEYVQIAVIKALIDVTQKSSFKVLITARLSTYRPAQYAHSFRWFPHSGPSPLEILSTRLSNFIRDPERYASYESAESETQNAAVTRAFDFLWRLQQERPAHQAMGRVLNAIAGDSVRRILKAAEHVFASEALGFPEEDVRHVRTQISEIRVAYARDMFVIHFGQIAEERVAASVVGVGEYGHDRGRALEGLHADLGRAITMVADRFTDSAGRELWQAPEKAWRATFDGLAGRIFRRHLRSAERLWNETLSDSNPGPIDWSKVVALAIPDGEQRGAEWAHAGRAFLNASGELTDHRPAEHEDQATPAEQGDEGDQTPGLRCGKQSPRILGQLYRSRLITNLFEDHQQASSGKARILQMLAVKKFGTMRLGELLEELGECYPGREDTILEFINDLLGEDHRLIWINKGFYFKNWKALQGACEEIDARATLTRAGWNHIYQMYGEITYVMECLAPSKRGSLSKQLSDSVLALEEMARKDEEELDRRRREGLTITDQNRSLLFAEYSVSLNVATESARGLVGVASRHYANMKPGAADQRNRERMDQVRSDVDGWRSHIDKTWRWLKEALGAPTPFRRGLGLHSVRPSALHDYDLIAPPAVDPYAAAERMLSDELAGTRFE